MPPKTEKSSTSSRNAASKRKELDSDDRRCRGDEEPGESSSKSQKASGWIEVNEHLQVYNPGGIEGRSKVAGFDLDGTIITTKSGKVFPKDASDWQFLYPEVPNKLQSLYNKEGFKVVIFTNQAGVSKGKTDLGDWRKKVADILKKIGVPVQVFVSIGDGISRKPAPGMWDLFVEQYNDGLEVDKSQSAYIGDAAGRPSGPKGKKDFSCGDRLFASNISLPFKTPEEFFCNKKSEHFEISSFDPKKYMNEVATGKVQMLSPPTALLQPQSQEVVILVGPPGIGKSHFVREFLKPDRYSHINRDTLKTWQKCVSETEKILAVGKSVVVDNTNGDKVSRARYVECAKKRGIPIRCFLFVSSLEHAKHNNRFRELIDPNHDHVPEMVFHSWKKNFVAPDISEGFSEIVQVRFMPKFSNTHHEKLYNMFLCEK